MIRTCLKRVAFWLVLWASVFSPTTIYSTTELTLDDLKKLEITCFVPSYLPDGFRLQRVDITYDEPGPDESKRSFPLYSIVYSNSPESGGTFSIESAREGIGDRNVMEEENTEETEIETPAGTMYLIYRPGGKDGRKDEIRTNWVSDENMATETSKRADAHPLLGRYHGFSATRITLAEFSKIAQSLHPLRDEKSKSPPSAQTPLNIHPKVFSMVNCWISDSESPVVTEINLEAVEKNGNEFNGDGLKHDGQWLQCPVPDTNGFMRYRVLESKGNQYSVEFQENGGGTLTTASVIDFDIENRSIHRDGKPATIRVLRVLSYNAK